MSTIPVLLLSLMMLSLSEAEEMMDPFALIRQTLKYWFKIYKIYHEEVALGYCWAEYFLRLEMQNVSMSRFLERGSEFTNNLAEKKYTFFRNGRSTLDSKTHRDKRSYRTSEEELSVVKKLNTIRDWRSINNTQVKFLPRFKSPKLSPFLFKFSRPESFASSLAIERIEGNKDENDSERSLKPRRVERSSSSENLRGRRDVNDQIGFVWPARIRQQSPSMYGVWKTESRSSRNVLGKNRLWNDGSGYTNARNIALSVIPGGIVNAPRQFITIRRAKNPSPKKKKRSGEKQLRTSDNRYRNDFQKSEIRGPYINYPEFPNYDSCTWGQSSWKEAWNLQPRGVANIFLTFFQIRETFMGFLRTLGFFVQVGRELIDYVESNSALACTKDYLWNKAVQWIDS